MEILLIINSLIALILLGATLFLSFKIQKMYTVIDQLMNFNKHLQTSFSVVYQRMIEIDRSGAFAADDEVGYVFDGIKGCVESLDTQMKLYPLDTDQKTLETKQNEIRTINNRR